MRLMESVVRCMVEYEFSGMDSCSGDRIVG